MTEEKNLEQGNEKVVAKKEKKAVKRDNFFKRIWKKFIKLCKDTVGEMRKVVWTPKAEVKKNTKLVVLTVIAIGAADILIVTACAYLINTIAGLIG